jgi:RHS repeat-associated protein
LQRATYAYDAQNRITSATVNGVTTEFTYDSRNRVVRRTSGNGTLNLTYSGWHLIEERNGGGELEQVYVHGAGTDEILVKITTTGPAYYHHDGLGSTIALTGENGALLESYRYDAFGAVTVYGSSGSALPASPRENRFLFTGREWLSQVDLYDYRNRVYSASLGRFLQTDPIRFAAGDVNIYRYVGNDPANSVDPWGLEVSCGQIGDTDYISEKDGEKYEVNRRLLRAGTLINLISKRFQPIPDGFDIFLVKWGQAYYTIKQEIFVCKDTCSGKAWIEKRRNRVAGSERVKYSYSLDIDADLGGSGPVGGA